MAFSRSFYRALAAGQSIDGAVADGRLAVFNRGEEDERDWGAPVLYLRADDGVLFPRPDQHGTEVAVDKSALRKKIVGAFRTEDLELMCSDIEAALAADGITLQVNLEIVGGASKAVQVLRLIEYLDNRGHLPYLVAAVGEHRPGLV